MLLLGILFNKGKNMNQLIIEKAKKIGIDIIRFTSQLNYDYLKGYLVERINNNYNNEFEEQDVNKRIDVKGVFPECKSIVACAFPYAQGYHKSGSSDKGIISVSSFGLDYHHIVRNNLENLVNELKRYINFKYKICVDTSPLIDKEICRSAGIGYYGKNSLLINDKLGSFIFLGYILTDIELNETVTDNINICEDCNICVISCPNKAIIKSGGINSKKCVSYLTQTKNYIPMEYRKNMRNQIYGCDICQVVCPKNKKVLSINSNNDYSQLFVDLNELLSMSNKQFELKYGKIAGSWRGKNIWKRNAIISIANLKLTNMFSQLKEELNNPSDMIKIYAAWSLMELNSKDASDLLYRNMDYENHIVKKEYVRLLEGET